MFKDNRIVIGHSGEEEVYIVPKMANRHGLITGATGTGKTTTLKQMAESFSDAGVPVFFSDIKGDLTGISTQYPVTFWDIYGQGGIPARTTISEMGPVLLSKLMDLNDTQSDILTVVFKIADDNNLLLIDTKDLKAMLNYVGENNTEYSAQYGNIAKASVNTILRNVVALEAKGGEQLFMEPALNIADWFQTSYDGKGMINLLDCKTLVNDGTMYATFLLWMLSELFETLPEVGDLDRPRMVFFFDEAHLLFKDASKALVDKIEQVVKLIRSKGVGVYFVTQSPKDIPDIVLSQLGNKIQHGLRAYTPADEKVVKAAAASFRTNPEFDTYETILNLGTGETVVSVLGEDGIPTITKKTKIDAPNTMKASITEEEKKQKILSNNLYLKYSNTEDRDSAYEFFERLKVQQAEEAETAAQNAIAEKEAAIQAKADAKAQEKAEKEAQKQAEAAQKARSKAIKQVASSTMGTIGRQAGKALGSKVGGSFGKTLGGNVGAQLGRSILGTFLK